MMSTRGRLVAGGLASALSLGGGGCTVAPETAPQPRPTTAAAIIAHMMVHCAENPKDITIVGFSDNKLLIAEGDHPVRFDIANGNHHGLVSVTMLGNTAVNGHPLHSDSAGQVLATLPGAKLIAGVPNHGDNINSYYAGDEGVTLACDAASPADYYHK